MTRPSPTALVCAGCASQRALGWRPSEAGASTGLGSSASTLEELGAAAFADSAVRGVKIPDAVREIGACTFLGCRHLATVGLPRDLEVIGEGAFQGTGLVEVAIPAGV